MTDQKLERFEENNLNKIVKDLKEVSGDFDPVFPLNHDKNLKIDYNYEASIIADLEQTNFDAPKWIPKMNFGKVVKVYDGDTIHVIARPLNGDGNIYKFSVRLKDVDTPEIGNVLHATEQDLEKALKAKHFLSNMILNKVVRLSNIEIDKYGRVLANISIQGKDISKTLVEEKLGYVYHGGKKKKEIADHNF